MNITKKMMKRQLYIVMYIHDDTLDSSKFITKALVFHICNEK